MTRPSTAELAAWDRQYLWHHGFDVARRALARGERRE